MLVLHFLIPILATIGPASQASGSSSLASSSAGGQHNNHHQHPHQRQHYHTNQLQQQQQPQQQQQQQQHLHSKPSQQQQQQLQQQQQHPHQQVASIKLIKHPAQQQLVRQNPGSLQAVARALKMAKIECQYQMRHEPWDCPINELDIAPVNMFGKITTRSFRETSFIHSVLSAALAHSVTRACTDSLISTCGRRQSRESDYRENIEFGALFARKFMDATHELSASYANTNNNIDTGHSSGEPSRRERKIRHSINVHNDEAGILHVIDNMRRDCKCHGLSGACTMETCWRRLSPFREVATKLHDSYEAAIRVVQGPKNPSAIGGSSGGGGSPAATTLVKKRPVARSIGIQASPKSPSRFDLLYGESSPDFCETNEIYNIRGTKGRVCSENRNATNSCEKLCCGRGYKTEVREEKYNCECVFKFCCELDCKSCTRRKVIHKCL